MPEGNFTYLKLRKVTFLVFFLCLVIIFFSGFGTLIAKSRDVKRKGDIKILAKALDLYYDEYGYYPDSTNDWRDWDLTYQYKGMGLDFLKILKDSNFIEKMVTDPINDDIYHYRYKKYPAGSFGCNKSFYILQVLNFELPTTNIGSGTCPELNWAQLAPNGYTIQNFD